MNCIFCKIISGEIDSHTVYEDNFVKVILDVNPDVLGHMLIIPKEHIVTFDELSDDLVLHINQVCKKMNDKLKTKLSIEGLTFIQNNGSVQNVKHYHLHLKPNHLREKKISFEELVKLLK